MVTTPNYDLDIDTTLGGNNASDYVIPSQKAIKSYVDNNSGGGGTVDQTFDGTSANAQSGVAITGAKFLKNEATQSGSSIILQGTIKNKSYAIGIGVNNSAYDYCTVVGATAETGGSYSTAIGYYARSSGTYSTALGNGTYANAQYSLAVGSGATTSQTLATAVGTSSLASGTRATALGSDATASGNYAIQIGYGTNNTANTLNVGFWNSTNTHYNWQLLDGATGLIPDARISTNIARTSQIPSITIDQTYDGTSTNAQSGVAIEGELANYVKADVTDDNTGTQCVIYNNGSSIDCSQFDNDGERGLSVQPYGAKIFYDGSEYNSVEARDSGVSIYCEGSFEFEDSNGYITLSTSNNNLAVNGTEVVTGSNTRFDGQWVYTKSTLANNVSMTNSSQDYSLSSYLPNDNYDYEVLFAVNATSGTSSGNRIYIILQSDISTAVETAYAIPRSNSSVTAYGTCILAVGSGRKVTVAANSTPKGSYYLYACGYRRIGTNT